MENGGTDINHIKSLRNLKLDSLLNNNYNHSNYYKDRKNKYTPSARNTFNRSTQNYKLNIPLTYRHRKNDSLMINYYNNYNSTYSSLNSSSEIVNGLQNTINDANIILNKSKNYLNTDIKSELHEYLPLSKSVKLKKRKKHSKKKKKKKNEEKEKEISFGENKINEEEDKINNNNNKIKELSILRSKLMESNIELRKQNKILEIEINNYKNQIYSRRYDLNMNNYNYILMMNKNFGKNKSFLQNSLAENTQLLENILKKIELNIDIYNQMKSDSLANKQLFKKIENYNRENAENQILNEENENKLYEFKSISMELLKKREEQNMILENLKNRGNNLMLKYDTNLNRLKKTEELINYFENAKSILEEELNQKTEKMNFNTNKIYQNKKRIIFYNNKLKNLSDDINNININKNRIFQINAQIRNKLLNYLNNEYNSIKNKNSISFEELKNRYDQIKKINNAKKVQLKAKEQEIEALKKSIDISSLNFEYFSKNKILNSLNKENDLINEIKINEKIQSFIKLNNKLNRNLNEIFLRYDSQIKQKDLLIQNLENQLIKEQSLKNKYIYPDDTNLNKGNKNNNNNNKAAQLKKIEKNKQILNNNQLNKINYTNIIYNRLNNIDNENYKHKNLNNKIDQKNNFNIANQNRKNEINDEYFNEKIEGNDEIQNKEIQTESGKNTDLEDIIKQNNLNNINQIKETPKNKIFNDNNKVNQKEPEKEIDDLGEIANQINEYNKSIGLSNKKQQKENEFLDNKNEGKNQNIPNDENVKKSKEKDQEEEEYEIDLNNMEMMDKEENEEEYNDINGENKEDNLIDADNNEENEVEQDINADEDDYNYYNDINDIHNEYEDYDENEEEKN